jgi:glycosyltransferase involved in cell wall biosynthesis
MQKPKLVHFIYNLGRGGAETMMVRVIKELDEYDHTVVTLFDTNHFGSELQCNKLVCLNLKNLSQMPLALFKFYKLIKVEKPALVHTHLFWPTIIARFTVPKKIPLFTTIHAFINTSVEYKKWYIRWLDKITFKIRKSIIIVVAKGAMDEYFSFLKIKPYKAYTLYTFVDIKHFNVANIKPKITSPTFKIVSVGALRKQKNYEYLIDAMAKIKDKNIELHIYGDGDLKTSLQHKINLTKANVLLKGEVSNIKEVLPLYDLYVMSSTYEGFSLSVLEAMAMGMPLLLSDIKSFREQCNEVASFYSLSDINSFETQLLMLHNKSEHELQQLGEKAKQRAVDNFNLQKHIQGLREIYLDELY